MRRETLWASLVPSDNNHAAGSVAILSNSLNAAGLALRPFTVVRTRGIFWIRSDQVAASEDYFGSIGAAVVSDQASAIGVTAVPTPETDRGSDLFFLYESLVGGITVPGTPVELLDSEGRFLQFDSRAMRKVEEGQDIVFVKETGAISSGANIFLAGRFLIKLH